MANHYALRKRLDLLAHGFDELIRTPPCLGLGDTEMALEREGEDIVFALRDQVDRPEPLGRLQFGSMKQCAGADGALSRTRRALPVPAIVGDEPRGPLCANVGETTPPG